jgi:hypothetical protein
MVLRSVDITDFLSVKGSTKLLLDPLITVLLGSNDHGKSNLLKAIEHLNADKPITAEDVNWDAAGTASLDFSFRLSDLEKANWSSLMKGLRSELSEIDAANDDDVDDDEEEAEEEPAPAPKRATATVPVTRRTVPAPAEEEEDDTDDVVRERRLRTFIALFPDDNAPDEILLSRRGVDTELSFKGIDFDDLPKRMQDFIDAGVPRVELIRTLTGNLQDSVSASELNTEAFEFMQGLFFYAGLNPNEAGPLFQQDDTTERQIQNASKVLDANLRRLWGQGTNLHFSLAHRQGKIEFLADDPAIKNRKARMSKRSDGVTQFFRTSIALNARRKKHAANSYLYLFVLALTLIRNPSDRSARILPVTK